MTTKKITRNRTVEALVEEIKVPEEMEGTLKEIQKRYGNSIVSFGKDIPQPARISTGSFMLDLALLGGIPFNRITKFVGQKHSGKTSMAYKVIANTQKMFPDKGCIFVDTEGSYDNIWAEKNGVDSSRLRVVQPETGEMGIDICDALMRTKEVSLLVLDSLAFLVPAKEIESSAEDQFIGLQSRMIGSFVRKAVAALIAERNRKHFITLLFLNQFRTKVGGYSPHGEPLTEPGGKGLGFAYSMEITLKNKEIAGRDSNDIEAVVMNEHAFSITKNKCNNGPHSGEFRLCRVPNPELGLVEGEVDDAATMLAYAKKFGAYTGAGASWNLKFRDIDVKLGSLDKAVKYLYENRDVYWSLRNHLLQQQAMNLGMPEAVIRRFD